MALFHGTFGLFWTLLPATDNLQKASPYYDPRISAFVAMLYVAIVVLLWGRKLWLAIAFPEWIGGICRSPRGSLIEG